MQRDDAIRLQHMLDAAREAMSFAEGKTRGDLSTDRKLALALMKDIEIIGEAASQVSRETQSRYDEVPWRDVIAMRNRLIHGYFDINLDIVWLTVTEELPSLVDELDKVLSQLDEQ